MPFAIALNRSTRPVYLFLVLGGTLIFGGCRSLSAPVWQTSTVVAAPVEVEKDVDRGASQQEKTPAHPRPRTAPVRLRLIALDDTAPDPPYRPTIPFFKRHSRKKSRIFDSETDSAESSPVSFEDPSESLSDAPGDSSDDETGSVLSNAEEDADEPDSDEEWSLDTEGDDSWDEDCRISFRDDARGLFPMLYCDALACVTWSNAIILGAAAGGAVAIREHLDGDVRDYTAEHPQRWGGASAVLRDFGEFSYQVPVIGAIYGISLWTQDEHTHEFSKTLISAYSITALTTVAIKAVTNTNRPTNEFQDGEYGFPSYHAASAFSIAAVADEYYGWPVGLPCYALAGLVGWSRIDQREHDLSDVVFGSILGFVIGKSVSAAHMDGITGCQVVPCFDPATRSFGAVFHKKF